MKLSVAIITFNEDRIIGKTLDAVHDLADEIIIVDSFSKDCTQEICARFPKVKFIQQRFLGFGKQKNFAIEKCESEWILFLDSDEVLDAEVKQSIKKRQI